MSVGAPKSKLELRVFLRRLVLAEILAPRGEGPLALRRPLRPNLALPRDDQAQEPEP